LGIVLPHGAGPEQATSRQERRVLISTTSRFCIFLMRAKAITVSPAALARWTKTFEYRLFRIIRRGYGIVPDIYA
jgi:hypothetical protein